MAASVAESIKGFHALTMAADLVVVEQKRQHIATTRPLAKVRVKYWYLLRPKRFRTILWKVLSHAIALAIGPVVLVFVPMLQGLGTAA